jgi:hypothetical protein
MPEITLPTIGSYIKVLEVHLKCDCYRTGDILLTWEGPTVNIKDFYLLVKTGYEEFHNTGRITLLPINIKTHKPLLPKAETVKFMMSLITKWEYHNVVDLTRVDLSQLDEDSLIPDDLYKITV